MNNEKTLLNERIIMARIKYSPEELISNEAKTRENNLVLIYPKLNSKEDETLFNLILKYDYYGSGVGVPIEYDNNYTVYFRLSPNGNLLGGVLKIDTKEQLTQCIIINKDNPNDTDCGYIYASNEAFIEKFSRLLSKSE